MKSVKRTKIVRNVLAALAIVMMSTVLCGAGCSNVADSSSSSSGGSGSGSGDGSSGGGSNGQNLYGLLTIGSIIMNDGSLKTANRITPQDKANAVAVVYKIDYVNMKVYAIGKVDSDRNLRWAKEGAQGVGRIFKLETSFDGTSPNYTFTGYEDGSKGLEFLRGAVNDADTDSQLETNYPAWYWCYNYGNTSAVPANAKPEYRTGWYFPSLPELYEIRKYGDVIKVAMQAIDENGEEPALNYLASSQYADSNAAGDPDQNVYPYAYLLDCENTLSGLVQPKKTSPWYVCAVRVFDF